MKQAETITTWILVAVVLGGGTELGISLVQGHLASLWQLFGGLVLLMVFYAPHPEKGE